MANETSERRSRTTLEGRWRRTYGNTSQRRRPWAGSSDAVVRTGDHRPNSGLREGSIDHDEVNEVLRSCGMTVIFGQQTRLRNGVVLPDRRLPRFHAGHDMVKFFYGAIRQLPDYLVTALLETNVSITMVEGPDLLVFHGPREHQSFHAGRTRRTIYMPEPVHARLLEFVRRREREPDDVGLFGLLAAIFVRLDKSERYDKLIEQARGLGVYARDHLQHIVDNDEIFNDEERHQIRAAARLLLDEIDELTPTT